MVPGSKPWTEQHFRSIRLPDIEAVSEYIGQTRFWLVLRAARHGDRPVRQAGVQERDLGHGDPCWRRCGSDGQKMSKHLRNYPDVNGVFNDFGSDAMRWFLMSSPILRGGKPDRHR